MKKKELLERVLSYENQDFNVSMIKKKKVEELRQMVITIEGIKVLQ